MRFAEHKSEQVMNIQIGTEFDNLDEGYDYYNVYSWGDWFWDTLGEEEVVHEAKGKKYGRYETISARSRVVLQLSCKSCFHANCTGSQLFC